MSACLFCRIVRKEIPSAIVYEDDDALAFLDITPVTPGHTLLVPKEHSRNTLEAPDETLSRLAPVVKKVARAVQTAMEADGINININNEPAAGQVIFHTHIHIIPRFADDGLRLWKGKELYADGEMDKTAKKIQAVL